MGESARQPAEGPSLTDIPPVLSEGEIVACQLVPWGSNYTFAVSLADRHNGTSPPCSAIYKPKRGEAPLWDFPEGTLYLREHLAYVLARLLGWDFIPPTVIRDGPHGVGSVQLYVEAEPGTNYFSIREHCPDQLRPIAVFDLLANNADRKAGHCLLDRQGRLWGIDHGLTFNAAPKLRTVLWDFCGRSFPESIVADLLRLQGEAEVARRLREALTAHLEPIEVAAFYRRLEALLAEPCFPHLDRYRNVPRPPW